jgi:hypothetical protein
MKWKVDEITKEWNGNLMKLQLMKSQVDEITSV